MKERKHKDSDTDRLTEIKNESYLEKDSQCEEKEKKDRSGGRKKIDERL